jgi:hypothetical protein
LLINQTPPGRHEVDLANGEATAYVEWFTDQGKAEIVVSRNGKPLARYLWFKENPDRIITKLDHGSETLPGISNSLMKKISLSLTDQLKIGINRAGGEGTFSRGMIPEGIRAGFPGAGTVVNGLGGAATAVSLVGDVIGRKEYGYETWVFENKNGKFTIKPEPRGWFRETYYYMTYISGELKGVRLKISKRLYYKLVVEGEKRWGYIDWLGRFVPGSERKELIDCGRIELDQNGMPLPGSEENFKKFFGYDPWRT